VANVKRYAYLGSLDGGFETSNRTPSMYDKFPTKPMFLFDPEMSGTKLTADFAARNLGSCKKSASAGISECLQEI